MAEELINVFKNQILLSLGNKSYTFEIVFPTYHRHTITEPIFNSDNLLQILKERLNPSVIMERGNLRETKRNLSTF